jgi:hypothetical protein
MKASTELLEEWDHDKSTPPVAYCERRSVKQLIFSSVPIVILATIALFTGLVLWQGFHWHYPFGLLPAVLWAYREYWQWANNYITCDPHDGNLCIQEKANILLLVLGSPDDVESIENVNLDTPTRSPLDYLFNTVTLYVGSKRLPNVMNVEHLLKIKQYRTSLEQQQKTLSLLTFEVNVAILAVLEQINKRLEGLGFPSAPVAAIPSPAPPVLPSEPDEDLNAGHLAG